MNEAEGVQDQRGFGVLFAEAERHVDFWEEEAIISFTEDVCHAMERAGVSRAELGRRLGTSQAYVTKVLRGNANFTLKTMARLALALDSELRMHLAPRRSHTHWLDDLSFDEASEYRIKDAEAARVPAAEEARYEDWHIAA